jgi:hypothetical protein
MCLRENNGYELLNLRSISNEENSFAKIVPSTQICYFKLSEALTFRNVNFE